MFFICLDCEREIVATSPFDLKYLVFLEKIKKLWKEPDFIEYQQENPSGKTGQAHVPLCSAVKNTLEMKIPSHVPLHGRGPELGSYR